jgi:methionyl-tRNA formyltransferase
MSFRKVAILGCKSTTQLLLENLLGEIKIDWLITIDKQLATKFEVADYSDLSQVCSERKIPIFYANNYSLKSHVDFEFFNREKIDLVFVAGWQRLVPVNILETFSIGAFGMHGSAMDLPKGRGRSPMNWALIEGKRQFYTNLFKYDPGVDSGDVLDTFKFQITDFDNAESLHYKNTLSMIFLIKSNLKKLLSGDFNLLKQNSNLLPTYYPKRAPNDSLLDWEQDITTIDRFIRAVSPPFNGAYSFVNGSFRISFLRANVFDISDFGFSSYLPGTVIQVFPSGKFLVKCFGGVLFVQDFISTIKINVGDIMNNSDNDLKYFDRNKQGNFDIIE